MTPTTIPTTFSGAVRKTQAWSRKAMADLWAQRTKLLGTDEIDRLDKLYKGRKATGALQTQEITYKTSSKSEAGRRGYGRLYGYGGYSLEQVQADVRATLCRELYHDLDIANCQPTLLLQIAERYSKVLPGLSHYVENRDEFLENLRAELDCSRAEAKSRVIAVLYGGATTHTALRSLSTEIRTFAAFLATTDDWAELFSLTPSDNRLGSFLATVLQNEERRCLLAMDQWMETRGWQVDVLAYDGFMVRHRTDTAISPELLQSLSDAVHAAVGYRVILTEKPMVGLDVLTSEPSSAEIASGVTAAAYAAMKATFEETHFYLAGACKVCAYDPETNEIHQLSKEQAIESLIEWHFPSTTGKFTDNTLFVPLWLKDPTRRVVKKILMGPPTDDASVFAIPFKPTWMTGAEAAAEADQAAAVTAFQDFLAKLVPEAELRGLFVEWLSNLLQKPFDNSKTCVILAGGKGCGKDTLGDFIGQYLMGASYFQNYDSTQQFWDKHDMGRFCKLFVKLEEAQGSLNRLHEADFKARITAETMTVNPKGVSPLTTPNYVRYLLTTNEASPVKLDDMERRFVIIPCSSALIGNMDYWTDLRAKLFNPAGAFAVASWLMEQTPAPFPRVLPKSDLHREMIDTERTSEERFAMESGPWSKDVMTASELFQEYRLWCAEHNHTATANSRWFGRNMGQVALDGKVQRRMLHGVSVYSRNAPTATA
jgi:hypothetical protein